MSEVVISVKDFHKTFFVGLRRKPSRGARGISFDVMSGEIFGFLGPNGAGKTTTIKALLGLIRPDSGTLRVLGAPSDSFAWRGRTGYLPEHPSFYDFLSGLELVTWFGRLSGLTRHEAEKEAKRQLERVGLAHAMKRRLRGYSKGMLQRAGLAQAMVGSPQVLILDEPMTGLDPIGRKDIRELILELRSEGRTVFYSTHILPDVEMTCDRVAIVHQGRVERVGHLDDILGETTRSVSLKLRGLNEERVRALTSKGTVRRSGPDWIHLELETAEQARSILQEEQALGAELEGFEPHREDLEALFIRTLGLEGRAHEEGAKAS